MIRNNAIEVYVICLNWLLRRLFIHRIAFHSKPIKLPLRLWLASVYIASARATGIIDLPYSSYYTHKVLCCSTTIGIILRFPITYIFSNHPLFSVCRTLWCGDVLFLAWLYTMRVSHTHSARNMRQSGGSYI